MIIPENLPNQVMIYSRPFDKSRWTKSASVGLSIAEIIETIEGTEIRARARNKQVSDAFHEAIRCLVLDLFTAYEASNELQVSVPKSSGAFTSDKQFGEPFLTYKQFIAAFDGLERTGLLTVDKRGFFDRATGKGKITRVRATEKLVNLLSNAGASHATIIANPNSETIVLKDTDKKRIQFEDTEFSERARQNLTIINGMLQSHWIDLDLTAGQVQHFNARMKKRAAEDESNQRYIEYGARSLYRVFNNGDWKQGGRFYGGWWQSLPKEYRKFLTIDCKPTVEVDYSGMHPVMMYAKVGEEFPNDPYNIGLDNVPRNLIKTTFNALINAGRSGIRIPVDYNSQELGISWAELQRLIVEKHKPIKSFFYSKHGVFLQAKDAAIAETVMLEFAAMNYPCLPVHDSFIVHHALADELKDIMALVFHTSTNRTIGMKAALSQISVKTAEDGVEQVGMNIANIYDEHDQYMQRWEEWMKHKESNI